MEFLHNAWVVIYNIGRLLAQSRFSLIIVALAVISLESVGQIKDIVVGLSYPESEWQVVFFILAVNWLAFQSWGWARFIFNRCHRTEDHHRGEAGYQRFLIDWLPRIYAMAAFWAAYRAASRANVHGIAYGIIAVGLVVLGFLYFRRTLVEKTAAKIKMPPSRTPLYLTFAIMAISTFFAVWTPVGFGSVLGAGAVVFLGLGSIIPVGTILVSAARENGFPVVASLLLLAVVFSPFNDNHHVREIEGQTASTDSVTLSDSLDSWLAQRDDNQPMVLVTSAGGGLRASYWTGVVLGRLQDKIPGFNKQLFAVSGVSGGSVGAVFYNGALANPVDCGDTEFAAPCFQGQLLKAIGRDYLAGTATAMLYGDLIQRFLPLPVFADRAAALEQSWEAGFRDTYPNTQCGLENSFTSFYTDQGCAANQWFPRLLINGTYEESGRRIITTSFKVKPDTFLDTHDFYQLNQQKALRASTAALNSARFTYVSPAGTFGDDVGHVIDGGYFENYGANTLTNLIDWLQNDPRQPLAAGLIVIAISNDSGIPLSQYELAAQPNNAPANNVLNEVLAPVIGLASTRDGHGMLAYKQLRQFTRELQQPGKVEMLHFYLEKDLGQAPPLGWILSEQSKENMQKQLTEDHNCSDYGTILKRFAVEPEACLTTGD